jgi:hypothetical protein
MWLILIFDGEKKRTHRELDGANRINQQKIDRDL